MKPNKIVMPHFFVLCELRNFHKIKVVRDIISIILSFIKGSPLGSVCYYSVLLEWLLFAPPVSRMKFFFGFLLITALLMVMMVHSDVTHAKKSAKAGNTLFSTIRS